jgi:hypothetical protein
MENRTSASIITSTGEIRTRPESRANLLCLEFSGTISHQDHEKFLVEAVREIIKTYSSYKLLCVFMPDFRDWEEEAADENIKIIVECADRCERLAYVNAPKKKIYQIKLMGPLIKCPIRYFDTSQVDEALVWIKN